MRVEAALNSDIQTCVAKLQVRGFLQGIQLRLVEECDDLRLYENIWRANLIWTAMDDEWLDVVFVNLFGK